MALKRVRFIQRRKAIGLTQEGLADALGVERSTASRWERAETEPQPWLHPKIAALLKVTAAELEELLADIVTLPGKSGDYILHSSVPLDFSLTNQHTVEIMESFTGYDIASRRQVVAQLVLLAGSALLQPLRQWVAGLPVIPVSSEARPETLAELEQAVVLFRRWDASGAGGLRRKAVVGQLNAVTESLNEHNSPGIMRRLFHVAAELAQLAGWMAYDQGLHGMAQRYYLLALHACREAAAPALGAKIIGDMTQLSTALGNFNDSLSLIRTALCSLPHGANDLVRAELLGLEARAYAHLGEREAGNAARSADACVEIWQEAQGDARPDWIHYMNQAEVDCLAANAFTELALRSTQPTCWQQYATRAESHTLSARASRDEGYTRSRIFDEVRLAKVRLAQREPVEAAIVAHTSLQMAQQARSTLVVDWFIRLDGALVGRYPDCSEVATFHEQLRDYLRRAAPARERELVARH
ncbi:helix-turn-helix transcriptional regulator [Nonomuraea sp. CA-143628]|uniref:helix-turn-helix transcriptional regulator n=1 Tax=Nonomuraea sp. CA-143628 TaxID=3239997 RepID=UPI003D9282F3